MKNNKGITLTSLIIYIMIMFVVLAVIMRIITYFSNNMKDMANVNFEKEFSKINIYLIDEARNIDNEIDEIIDGKQIIFTSGNKFTYSSKDKSIYLNDTIRICEKVEQCLFEQKNAENGKTTIILTIQIEDVRKTVEYVMERTNIDEIVSESDYTNSVYVNKPKLAQGMIPIKYNGSNWEICSEDDKEWYNYGEDKMQWANIMLSDGKYKTTNNTATIGTKVADADLGSMFVWIPRYAYSINEYGVAKNGEGTTQKITDVTFLVGTTNRDIEGNEYALDYDVQEAENNKGKSTTPIVHPAFKFGADNLSGLWVAKFEASMEGQTNTNTDNANTGDNNTTKKVKVLPNVQSWRYIQIGNIFTNCLNMNNDGNIYGITNAVDSHLMKNSEWGAVAYIAVSQYGITPTLNSNSSYKTGNGDYKNKSNLTQSTTGNVTGIYDMCGGAWEYVAAYYDNGNSNLRTYGTATYFSGNKLNTEYEKYWDRYEVDSEEKTIKEWENDNAKIKELAEKRLNLMKDVKGVGMYDVKNTFSFCGRLQDGKNTWNWMTGVNDTTSQGGVCLYNNDYTLVGNISRPFLLRGGVWTSGSSSGVFASHGLYGNADHFTRLPSGACSIVDI